MSPRVGGGEMRNSLIQAKVFRQRETPDVSRLPAFLLRPVVLPPEKPPARKSKKIPEPVVDTTPACFDLGRQKLANEFSRHRTKNLFRLGSGAADEVISLPAHAHLD